MSVWLTRARARVAAVQARGDADEYDRSLIESILFIIERLEKMEALGCLHGDLANSSADVRLIYFAAAGDLKHFIRVIERSDERSDAA